MSGKKVIFVGTLVSSLSLKVLSITEGFISVENGKIIRTGTKEEYYRLAELGVLSDYEVVNLTGSQFILPGFVDCHTHAPQFPNIGLGLDCPLLEWLDKYTLPLESRYGDVNFAAQVYDKVVQRFLKHGTTTACYFGTIHPLGTLVLGKSVAKYNQRALVGKVSINRVNKAKYYTETEQELLDVESFVKNILEFQNDLVLPIITPRFALSCDEELMMGLAKISEKYGCRIQSHISENLQEIEEVLKLNPGCKNYADVYDRCKLLNNRCIMAHAVHLQDEEVALFASKGVAVAHCPASNTRLKSGLCPVRKLLDNDIKVGLGTDVSGGDSASILDAMRRTMDVSTHLELLSGQHRPIDYKEALYLATLGGAKALNLENKIGSLEVGKDFDALLVDVYPENGPIDRYPHYSEDPLDLVQKFVYLADDRNILQVYVKGKQVKHVS